jgi:hypothetical protein
VSAFFRRAEEILEIATNGSSGLGDALLVLDRQGGFRMLEPAGWSLTGLAAETGAEAVYKVERCSSGVRVEGWNGSERCLLEAPGPGRRESRRSFTGVWPPVLAVAAAPQPLIGS